MKLEELLKEYDQLPMYLITDSGCTSVFSRSGFSDFPINIAAVRGKIDELDILVKAGADINQIGEHGYTPLHEAVEQGFEEVVEFLLSQGADPKIKNDQGDTVYDLAKLLNKTRIAELLNRYGA